MAGLDTTLRIAAIDDSAKAIDAFKQRVAALDKFVAARDPFHSLADKVTAATDRMAKSIGDSERVFSAQRDTIDAQVQAMSRLLEQTTAVASAQMEMTSGVRESTRALEAQGAAAGRSAQRVGAAHREMTTFGKAMSETLPFLGPGILHETARAVESGATVQERIAQLKAAGATDEQITRAKSDFRDFSRTHAGVIEADYLGGFQDARTIAPDEAFGMAKHAAVLRSALRNSGLPVGEGDVGDALRIMDELGLKTDTEREEFINQLLKTQQTFRTQVPISTNLAAIRNAKQSVYKMSPDFINSYLPTILQSAGQNGGTEIMTAYSNYIGQHMQHSEMVALAQAGFIDPKDLQYDKNGKVKQVKKGAKFFEEDMFKSNIVQWSWDFHDKFMSRKGATEDQFDSLVAKMPRNMGALISFNVANEPRLKRDADTRSHAIGDKAADNASLAQNPVAGLDALMKSIEQFGAAVTAPGMDKIGAMLSATAQGLQKISAAYGDFAAKYPNDASLYGLAATTAGLGAGGWYSLKLLTGISRFLGFGRAASAGLEGGISADAIEAALLGGAETGLLGTLGAFAAPAAALAGVTAGSLILLGPDGPLANYYRPQKDTDFPDEGMLERSRRSRLVWHDGAFVDDPEAAHARALSTLMDHGPQGDFKVSLDPNSKANVEVTLRVEPSDALLRVIARIQAAAEGALSVSVGRMDSDAAPLSRRGVWDR